MAHYEMKQAQLIIIFNLKKKKKKSFSSSTLALILSNKINWRITQTNESIQYFGRHYLIETLILFQDCTIEMMITIGKYILTQTRSAF